MFDELKAHCTKLLPFTADELAMIDQVFVERTVHRSDLLLQTGEVCRFLGFVAKGAMRQFHVKDGDEQTCDIALPGAWVTDFASFVHGRESTINIQALVRGSVYLVQQDALHGLYAACPKFETYGRLVTEEVLQRASDRAMSLAAEMPEERYTKLLATRPELFRAVPQKHIASLLGLRPETLSRIRARALARSKS